MAGEGFERGKSKRTTQDNGNTSSTLDTDTGTTLNTVWGTQDTGQCPLATGCDGCLLIFYASAIFMVDMKALRP